MTIANGANHKLAYIAEVTAGVTPATPAFTILPHTGVTIGTSKETQQSANLGGRQLKCFKHGNVSVAGPTNHEIGYGDFDPLLEAALCGTWNTNVLKSGVTRRTFTIEREFDDLGKYIRYRGCEINTFELSVEPNSIPTINFGWIGLDQDTANTMVTGATYTDDSGSCPFDSFTGVVNEAGSPIGVVTQVSMILENGIEALYAVGSKIAVDKSIGKSLVTGNITVYFENETLMNKFINNTESSLDVTLVGTAGTLKFDIPRLSFTSGGNPDVSGDGSVTLSLDLQGLYDVSDESNIVITRTPA